MYNDVMRNDTNTPCSACRTGRTTVRDGATSVEDCTACAAGYGGKDCATPCGGATASYGPVGRPLGAECVACSVAQVGYSFGWQRAVDTFAPKPVAKLGAASGYDCLAEYVQVGSGCWAQPAAVCDHVAAKAGITCRRCTGWKQGVSVRAECTLKDAGLGCHCSGSGCECDPAGECAHAARLRQWASSDPCMHRCMCPVPRAAAAACYHQLSCMYVSCPCVPLLLVTIHPTINPTG